jgi:hypothetical protein
MPTEKLDYVTTLSPEMVEKAEKELGEDEHRRTESVLALREWVKKQPHLHAMPQGTHTVEYRSSVLIVKIDYGANHNIKGQ